MSRQAPRSSPSESLLPSFPFPCIQTGETFQGLVHPRFSFVLFKPYIPYVYMHIEESTSCNLYITEQIWTGFVGTLHSLRSALVR